MSIEDIIEWLIKSVPQQDRLRPIDTLEIVEGNKILAVITVIQNDPITNH